MSHNIGFLLIDEACMDFLVNNPGNGSAFINGEKPKAKSGLLNKLFGKGPVELPVSWPNKESTGVVLSGDAMYWNYLFNGDETTIDEPLEFLVETLQHGDWSRYAYGESEVFAMGSKLASTLISHIKNIHSDSIKSRVKSYFEKEGEEAFVSDMEDAVTEMGELSAYLSGISKNQGILWYVC